MLALKEVLRYHVTKEPEEMNWRPQMYVNPKTESVKESTQLKQSLRVKANNTKQRYTLPAKSDSGVMFCLQSY